MNEQSVTIVVAILGALGAGGIGAAIVNGLFNRPKLLSEIYEQRLKALTDRVTCLEEKEKIQTDKIDNLKTEIDKREDMIEALQRENEDLKSEITKLKAENRCKDNKIAKLQSQVADLTARLDAMNGSDGG
jgi:chromosome segregation ATPase